MTANDWLNPTGHDRTAQAEDTALRRKGITDRGLYFGRVLVEVYCPRPGGRGHLLAAAYPTPHNGPLFVPAERRIRNSDRGEHQRFVEIPQPGSSPERLEALAQHHRERMSEDLSDELRTPGVTHAYLPYRVALVNWPWPDDRDPIDTEEFNLHCRCGGPYRTTLTDLRVAASAWAKASRTCHVAARKSR
ncbi:hypothetical protein [Frankia sp. Cas3]|uniref:hypothetical protein n=1 Tax=Frankia sp. Cas3 TaxID=3073926 RepID=UPI002AD2B254|nr:hypothetical protein [Frankia sp. Cas3]